MIALVEPPSASSTRSAFSTDFALTIWSGVTCRTDEVDRRDAGRLGRAQAVGVHRRDRGGARQDQPSASAMQAMVEAVPITAQVPAVTARLPSTSAISSALTSPAR